MNRIFDKSSQSWLSAVQPRGNCEELVFGGKKVLYAFDDDVQVNENPAILQNMFVSEISRLASIDEHGPLVVVVCGPTSLGQDILFDWGNVAASSSPNMGLFKVEDLQQAVGINRRLMLVTPSMLAVHWWLVNPNVNEIIKTTATSHVPPNTGKCPISSDRLVKLFARRCAPLFSEQIISRLFTRHSLFLHERYELEDPEKAGESLWPLEPTPEQVSAGDALQSAARDAVLSGFAWYPSNDKFYFFPFKDGWEMNLKPRRHLHLAIYNKS